MVEWSGMPHANPISYVTANLYAQPYGYNMTREWMRGDEAASDLFRPVERFADRFDHMVAGIRALGFTSLDLWCAHLHPSWASVRHLEDARAVLDRHGVTVTAYVTYGGSTVADLRMLARVMDALGTDLISGQHGLFGADRAAFVKELRALKLRFAYENHPEKSADEILSKIGAGDEDVMGIAYDTGWACTQGIDSTLALPSMLPRIFHFHAKDLKPRRTEKTGYPLIDIGHETCALGDGIAGVEQALRSAVAGGFTGPIGVEHEPETHDPAPECRESLARVRAWLA